jgi:C4-dicarboxylate-specific signal transduction histidine kinase
LAVAIDRTRLLGRLLQAERMAAWGEMSARSAHMIGNAVFGIKGHLNELQYWINDLLGPQELDEETIETSTQAWKVVGAVRVSCLRVMTRGF